MVELVGFKIPDVALSQGGAGRAPRAAQDMMSEFPLEENICVKLLWGLKRNPRSGRQDRMA